ncbi:MAG: winged helix-turn-helix transcriptional regulator [Nitrososphaerota archaeon]|jgi:CTP-dependent riboflavin kinase|nr:winged helix-turn-helix transcriptional regulator [Nitrososphaerota archaeon]MDG6932081.1 winged helix-turn-helix transcriptional regulator [Nitrososphaerota archaeon]MDG6935389.1 winged helix-turn-helix transcriptional regulator [Nitrososphaerota archaeon]MDG6944480.1 winged helix-turn-helix transcriptional regulator [Nitrososphaerota archaeon]
MSENQVRVDVEYGSLKASFAGDANSIYEAVNRFLAKNLPELDLAQKIHLRYDSKDLIEKFGNFIRITEEGPRVVMAEGFSLKQKIGLQLAAAKLSYLLSSMQAPGLSIQEISSDLGVSSKSVSSRLSELVKEGHAERISNEVGNLYMITTTGIMWLAENLKQKSSQ